MLDTLRGTKCVSRELGLVGGGTEKEKRGNEFIIESHTYRY